MFTFATDYCIAAFLSTTGALQFAFSVGGIHGLLAFKRAIVARTLGIALAAAGFVFFFAVGERNINDYEGGLDAPAQALFFFWGSLGALIFTLALTSLINWRMRGGEGERVMRSEEGETGLCRDSHPHPSLPQSRGKGAVHPHPDLPPARGKGVVHPHPSLPLSRGKGVVHPHPSLPPSRGKGVVHPHPSLPPSRGKEMRDDGPDVGIDALRHTNYALALWRSAGYWWKRWKR